MAEQHVKIFQGLGLPQDFIDKVEAITPEAAKEWKPDEELATAKKALTGTFYNDAEFLKGIPEDKLPEDLKKNFEKGQYARFQNEIKQAAKTMLGLEDKDLSDITEEDNKSIKKLTAIIAEKYLGKKGGVEGAKELQSQITKLTESLEKKDSDWEEKLNAKLQEVNGATNTKLIKAMTRSALAQLSEIELNVPAAYITDPVLAELSSKYTVTLDEADNLVLMQKQNPKLAAMEGGKPVTFEAAAKAVLLEKKLGKAKEAQDDKPGPRKTKYRIGGEEGSEGGEDVIELPEYIRKKTEEVKRFEK